MARPKATWKPKTSALEIVPNPKQAMGLTPLQKKFCEIYATEDVTQTDAARMAGYAEASAAGMASSLLNGRDYPQALDYIRQIKSELAKKYEVTFDNHVRKLAEIRDAAFTQGNYPAAVSAEKARGQAAGLYITRQEILVGKIDQMSKEEVMAEIRRLQSEFPALAAATATTIDLEAAHVTGKETLGGPEKRNRK
jgi:hypothetical protein